MTTKHLWRSGQSRLPRRRKLRRFFYQPDRVDKKNPSLPVILLAAVRFTKKSGSVSKDFSHLSPVAFANEETEYRYDIYICD
jgi:hypothetical protein